MDLMSDDAIGALGLLVAEAAEKLVDSHDESLDKRAAMMIVDSPTFNNEDGRMQFAFKVKGNRQQPIPASIEVMPEPQGEDEDFDYSPLSVSLNATPLCTCEQFKSGQRCPHTLAISWWLQEQLGRRSINEVFEFLGELEVDAVAAGRQLVGELLGLAGDANQPRETEETRLQWRIGLSSSRYYCPISITPYEQRPRKNGKGWTKGKEVRSFDLLRRDFSTNPLDGKIAALVANPSYSFDDEHFGEFQAINALAGHAVVAWDDAKATTLSVHSAELVLTLEPVEFEEAVKQTKQTEQQDEIERKTLFRPRIHVNGINVNLAECKTVLGHASPVEPVVVIADQKHHRLIACTLRDPRAVSRTDSASRCRTGI